MIGFKEIALVAMGAFVIQDAVQFSECHDAYFYAPKIQRMISTQMVLYHVFMVLFSLTGNVPV